MSMLSRNIEDYIKTIYSLEEDHERASTKRIAERLHVTMASATGMVKHLASEGYVEHRPYYGAVLTAEGKRIALGLIRRHRIIELFLQRTLSLTWDEVHEDAEVLEHAISDRLLDRMDEYLGHPEFDPHGSPIPAKDGTIRPPAGLPLTELPPGTRAVVVEVYDRDADLLRHLTSLRIEIGSKITVLEDGGGSGDSEHSGDCAGESERGGGSRRSCNRSGERGREGSRAGASGLGGQRKVATSRGRGSEPNRDDGGADRADQLIVRVGRQKVTLTETMAQHIRVEPCAPS
jgi:DtxR family Mn-dependent transcriptional regulator